MNKLFFAIYLSIFSYSFHALANNSYDLFNAIEKADAAKVEQILTADPSLVNARNHAHSTPLIRAVLFRGYRFPEVINAILKFKPSINAVNDDGNTALSALFYEIDYDLYNNPDPQRYLQNIEKAKTVFSNLLTLGAITNVSLNDHCKSNLLDLALDAKAVTVNGVRHAPAQYFIDALVKSGLDLKSLKNGCNYTALDSAISKYSASFAEEMINLGIRGNVYPIELGNLNSIKLLHKYQLLFETKAYENLHRKIYSDCYPRFYGDSVSTYCFDTISTVLDLGADVNSFKIINFFKFEPSSYNHVERRVAYSVSMLKFLISKNLNLKQAWKELQADTIYANAMLSVSVLKTLSSVENFDFDFEDIQTMLKLDAWDSQNEITRIKADHQVVLTQMISSGKLLKNLPFDQRAVFQLMFNVGGSDFKENIQNIIALIPYGLKISIQDFFLSAMMRSLRNEAESYRISTLKYLIAAGAKFEYSTNDDYQNGNILVNEISSQNFSQNLVDYLLDLINGDLIKLNLKSNNKSEYSRTPLLAAIANKRGMPLIARLISLKVDLNIRDDLGKNALDYAREFKDREMIIALVNAGAE